MSVLTKVKKLFKKKPDLPVSITVGVRMYSADTGISYVFDGEKWNAVTPDNPVYSKKADRVQPPASSLFPRGNSYSSPFSSVAEHRPPDYTLNASRTRSQSSYTSSNTDLFTAAVLSSSDSSCYSSSDSSSSCDSGGCGGCD